MNPITYLVVSVKTLCALSWPLADPLCRFLSAYLNKYQLFLLRVPGDCRHCASALTATRISLIPEGNFTSDGIPRPTIIHSTEQTIACVTSFARRPLAHLAHHLCRTMVFLVRYTAAMQSNTLRVAAKLLK